MNKKQLYLLDATAFCYRAFYAIRGLATSFGQPTGAVYGFINILNKILKDKKPDYIAACFDVSRETFRSKKFVEYKIQRPSMPDDLISQIPIIKEVIASYGITIFEKQGYEADDIIATLAHSVKTQGLKTTIVSSDKDILQLVSKDTEVFNPYKEEGVIYNEDEVIKRFGVKPSQIIDLLSLMGDAADNISSVPGIGEKTAVELIKKFGSIDSLLENIDKVKKAKVRDSLIENIDKIKFNKELIVLVDDLDLDFDLAEIKVKEANINELTRIFKRLEFKKFIKDLHGALENTKSSIEVVEWDKADLKRLIDKGGELGLYGECLDNLVFYHAARFLRLDKSSPEIREILTNVKIKKIGHDLKKLKCSLAREGLHISGLYFDTMIASYLINPSKGNYGLEALALDYLDKIVSLDSLAAAEALNLINELRPKLEEELNNRSMGELFCKTEMPLLDVLAEMEILGIKLDLRLLKSLSLNLEDRLTKLVKDIYKISGEEFNINSPKQLGLILFEKLKLPVIKKTKTGFSTDEEVLNKLADKHKLPALLLEYRQLTKLKTTYIDALPQLVDSKTGRIHTSFNQAATETGRLSSSNPNLQNIPVKTDIGREIRKAFIASGKDNCLIACDYSQIELRILAHLSKDERLLAAFKNNEDIHRATASLIYGLDEDKISEQMRDSAKRINFGIVYGLTFYGLSRDLDIAPDQAQHFIDAYFLRYPGVKAYIDAQIEKARDQGFVTTILGRRRYIPEIKSKNQGVRQFAERQAVNTPIQGSASDLIKLAMISIDDEIKKNNLRSRMVLQIHDELVFDLPKDELDRLVVLVRHRMENVLKLDVPVKVDIKMGQNWLDMQTYSVSGEKNK